MATPNVGILTNAGKNLIDQVNAGKTKIAFSKIVFSSMNNNQLTDDQIKALTTVAPQEIVVNNPEVTLDNGTGETRIRATGNNKALTDGVYVKTYAVYAKDDSGNEILYGITVSPNPNYLPDYDGVTPQAVTYSYKVNISNTSNITFGNSDDIYVSDTDLAEALQPYAKTVDVNQQLDKKVNIADMRKPASDVAGIEEVNAKQDKLTITPADDSKVVHNSGNETIGDTKTFTNPIKGTIDGIAYRYSAQGDDLDTSYMNDSVIFTGTNKVLHAPAGTDGTWAIIRNYNSNATNGAQSYYDTNHAVLYLRTRNNNTEYSPWIQVADDSKVAHLSGANNFDTVPTVKNNPLLLASSLPSDLARTGQANTFTQPQTFSIAPVINDASQDKGDTQAATMADLKSLEKSAWRQLNVSSIFFSSYEGIYKINSDEKFIEICASGIKISPPGYATLFDLSPIVDKILDVDMEAYTDAADTYDVNFKGSLLSVVTRYSRGYSQATEASISSNRGNGFARVYYNNLQPGVI